MVGIAVNTAREAILWSGLLFERVRKRFCGRALLETLERWLANAMDAPSAASVID